METQKTDIKLSGKDFDQVLSLLKECLFALDAEIDAVRERPSQDTFESGTYLPRKDKDEHDYSFKSNHTGLRFAEIIRARYADKSYDVSYVDAKDDEIILRFPEHLGPQLGNIDLEWENDFVLRRMQDQLRLIIAAERDEHFAKIADLFFPKSPSNRKEEKTDYARRLYELGEYEVLHDGSRNEAQCEAIQKAMFNGVTFVWGPPGTGKTTTLGYLVANLVMAGKKVLFVSNTNRAVDVGMLNVMEAFHKIGKSDKIPEITRFGDIALPSEALDRIHHERQADARRTRIRQRAAQYQEMLSRFKVLQDEIETLENQHEPVPKSLEDQLDAAISIVRKNGGIRKMEELVENLQGQLQNVDFYEVISKNVVGTTLAKVCTSDLFFDMQFDAVVVDESSMASLPYLAIMACRCKTNLVVAGDPMQLPPISISKEIKAKELLEQDIFAYASKAKEPIELFYWHDFNPLQTSFFDIQYRLNEDLAEIISEVFYEGRLKTGKLDAPKASGAKSYKLVDTSFFEPSITKKGGYGFSPKNEMHLSVLVDLAHQLVLKDLIPMEQIGVIVPFRSAVWDVRLALKKKGLTEVEVGTIHTFQGREKKIIIFDTVMSGQVEGGRTRHYSVRPFDETKNGLSVPRLLNVAFSRSKDRLYIIADMNHIRNVYKGKFLGKLLERLAEAN